MRPPWLPPLLIIGALAGLALWAKQHQAEPAGVQIIRCADPVTGCGFVHHGRQSQLRFSAVPKPLEAFDVELYAPAASKASVRFQMGGMEMGFSRYDLKAGSAGLFKAAAILLPVCTQARSDWSAFFTLDDTRYQVSFQAR
jgi:hypothetical protein